MVIRNIEFVKLYGGLFELNSSALRKGWNTSYPKRDIANAIIKHGGARFCLSDDAHSLAQVGLNYDKTLAYVKSLGLERLYFLDLEDSKVIIKSETINSLEKHPFW